MKIGDVVEWESQSKAYRKVKRGVVVAVIPAGRHVDTGWLNSMGLRTNSTCGYGMPRNHESYVIRVKNSAYWPRVKHLKVVPIGEPELGA